MSVTAFRPVVTVTVEEKGTGKAIPALGFEPTSATAQRLADHKLVFRPRANGFQLYAQFNPEAGNARLGAIAARTSFVFGIRLTEADFLARYHPDLDPATGPNLYLANLDADGTVRTSGQLSLGYPRVSSMRASSAPMEFASILARIDVSWLALWIF